MSIAACETYDPAEVQSALDAALAPLGGMAAFVSPGQTVLLKVNLLSKALPERAVTTHPEVVRAAIRSARACGGLVSVADSPGGPNTAGMWRGVKRDSGIEAVCADEGVDLLLLDDECVRVSSGTGSLYGTFTIGRAVAETDVLITLPKFKTHGFMMFTGAVKNLFGCIPGLEKAQYHVKVPDRDDFGSMLIDLMIACKPKLAIMDAIVGMEGDGPAGGTPRAVGVLLASADSVSLDVIASAMAGLDPMEVYSNKAAARRGLGPSSTDEVEVLGVDWRSRAPEGFALPAKDISAGMPPWLGKRLRTWTTARPVLERGEQCTRCKRCEESCPVNAIVVGDDGPAFDHSTCIRCYCCQELCPPQVIGLKVPPLARLMTRSR
ncbi:MAG: DUF362 domain-containing protein [Coriobacteriia bacterium]|nr:DUF362 domain-containing protein [Coriobacteriia bacterium]